METKRLIGRLDIKGEFVIKGIQLEGLRKIGHPNEIAKSFYEEGLDELFYQDCVASLYSRRSLVDVISAATSEVFVPLTVGGGVRSVGDARELLLAGADKVAINSAALMRPTLLKELISEFGGQCVVVSVEAKVSGSNWNAFFDSGREDSNINVVDWVADVSEMGVGEIVVTSVDRDGGSSGPDFDLANAVRQAAPDTPMIYGGGIKSADDVFRVLSVLNLDGVVIGSMFHYQVLSPSQLRLELVRRGVAVRSVVPTTGLGAERPVVD